MGGDSLMTKTATSFIAGVVLSGLFGVPALIGVQGDESALTGAELKTMVTNLGFTAKDLEPDPEKLKIEFTVTKESLDIPVAAEVSASKRFIWLTAFLGDKTKMEGFEQKAVKLLDKNYSIQPTMFYTTSKGNLMIGICVENRSVTPAILKWRIDKLVGDVVSTEEVWGK